MRTALMVAATLALAALCVMLVTEVRAQLSMSTCVTPYGWCAVPLGPAGTPCGCPTPFGWLAGVRQ